MGAQYAENLIMKDGKIGFKNSDTASATPQSGFSSMYVNGEKRLYFKADDGVAHDVLLNSMAELIDLLDVESATSTAGQVLIGGSADAARANLAALINAPATTTAQGVALSAANVIKIQDTLRLSATNDNTANTMTVIGIGSGRLAVSETFTDGTDTWTKTFIHAYFGKKGAIDVVIQDKVDMEMRDEPKQRATNILSDVLYGVKTFNDGAQQFLDVLIAA